MHITVYTLGFYKASNYKLGSPCMFSTAHPELVRTSIFADPYLCPQEQCFQIRMMSTLRMTYPVGQALKERCFHLLILREILVRFS
jgi:hypothetical protein